MPIFREFSDFIEYFVLENSSTVYGIVHDRLNPLKAGNGIVWICVDAGHYGIECTSTMMYSSAGFFRNRVLKIKNIKLLHKTG